VTARAIRPLRVNHMNAVVADFDASISHFEQAFGAEFMVDMPQAPFHACLFEIGRVIFELFVPHDFLISARLGPHYVGLEWQADMDEVRAALTDHGVRTVRDIGLALHTDPADCFGVAHEFYAGEFHTREWDLLGGPIKPASYWREDHPMGLAGLRGYTHIVEDLDAAGAFYRSFLSAEPTFDESRPAIAARARGLRVADATIELLAPDGEGWLARRLRQQGQGIHSTVFTVRDLAQARRYCTGKGIPLEAGTADGHLAVPASANRGIVFEFAEAPG
jgi:catechol 2,3-dioxygenase-like lactoylglutathione lyase family enzyme